MAADEFRAQGHRLVEWIADYLEHTDRYPVLAQVKPGEIRRSLPRQRRLKAGSVRSPSSTTSRSLIVPGLTHWNQPGFFAYFAISASAPGILADFCHRPLNQQAMLWRTSPAATELEAVTLGWLRDLMGLPSSFDGVIYDTASISTLHALAAAREDEIARRAERRAERTRDLPPLRIYCSEHAHSSIDKRVILLGHGHEAVRQHSRRRSIQHASRRARRGRSRDDRAAGCLPIAVVATVGDDVDDERRSGAGDRRRSASVTSLWLHIDGAYGGVAAIVPECR